MQLKSKADAQQRADQIRYFQAELELIEQENILSLSDTQRNAQQQPGLLLTLKNMIKFGLLSILKNGTVLAVC